MMPVQFLGVPAALHELQALGLTCRMVQPFAVGMADNGVPGAVDQQDRHTEVTDALNRFFLLQPGVAQAATHPGIPGAEAAVDHLGFPDPVLNLFKGAGRADHDEGTDGIREPGRRVDGDRPA